MAILQLKILDSKAEAFLPKYMTEGASGMDLCACLEMPITLQPGERFWFPTGLAVAVPEGHEAQIRPRSGLALKHGITLPNSPGTIDSDYRGELKVIVMNLGQEPFVIEHGMRIAQMVIASYVRANIEVVDALESTERGVGGFGHTGTHHEKVR